MSTIKYKEGEDMSFKTKVTKKQMESLGLKKTKNGDYDYIDSKGKSNSANIGSINTVEGKYEVLLSKKDGTERKS